MRLAAANGELEPDWPALRLEYRHMPVVVEDVRRLWQRRQRPTANPPTPPAAPRLRLVPKHRRGSRTPAARARATTTRRADASPQFLTILAIVVACVAWILVAGSLR
jgi:hypothetical protein